MAILFRPEAEILSDIERLQSFLQQASRFNEPSDIRANPGATFPVINVGNTPDTVEVMALAPGLDPKSLEITIDKGVLLISGERKSELTERNQRITIYANERFSGGFRRVVSLPEDVDPANVKANYANGLLRVTLSKRESSKPRRISVN
jgi:HSP20 family protein